MPRSDPEYSVRLVGDQGEEALHQIQPIAVAEDEVKVPARPLRRPHLDLRVLVGALVVDDQVSIQLGRYGRFNAAQESEELLMSVSRLAVRQPFATEYIQRRKQRCRAMARLPSR
jgi:hypothetical protein